MKEIKEQNVIVTDENGNKQIMKLSPIIFHPMTNEEIVYEKKFNKKCDIEYTLDRMERLMEEFGSLPAFPYINDNLVKTFIRAVSDMRSDLKKQIPQI